MRGLVFGVSFLLAFLMFAIEPMATKLVLPTLGGSPAVWNTAMLAFQSLLLAGYFYAHVLTTYARPKLQLAIHTLLVAASFLLLPIAIELASGEGMLAHPIFALARALVLQIGLPFFVLAATAPLLQAWVSRADTPLAKTPYILYSASNLGSLVALVGYVTLVEPLFDLPMQRSLWSGLYSAGVAALLVAGFALIERMPSQAVTADAPADEAPLSTKTCLGWMALAFLPSSLSLGVTTYISTDIAAVPLLWVVPLAIYLLSFVDAFSSKPVLVKYCMRIAPLAGMVAVLLYGLQGYRFALGFAFHLIVFATLAFALHGYLAQAKPVARRLTSFYLCLSFGGMLGGVLNALVAPLLFAEPLEYPLTLLAASVTAFVLWQGGKQSIAAHAKLMARIVAIVLAHTVLLYALFSLGEQSLAKNLQTLDSQTLMMAASTAAMISLILQRRYIPAFYALVGVDLVMILATINGTVGYDTLYRARNFFGVEKVFERTDVHGRFMMHNTTLHGVQSLAKDDRLKPLSYYAALGEVFATLPIAHAQPMAAVGLGVGSMQCHAAAQQRVDFFEINPMVAQLAENPDYFTYLRDCPGTHRIVMGDGRLELAKQDSYQYGVIVLDAFSSDAIPAHLLTQEAFAMYFEKLARHGVLLIHTTNRHIDLWPLIAAQARGIGGVAYGKHFFPARNQPLVYQSFWVAVGRTREDVAPLVDTARDWVELQPDLDGRTWTDQYSNILPYLKVLR